MQSGDLSSFGALLRAFRTRRSLTQQQLAEGLGLRRNTIGTWERGDFLPKNKTMVLELARYLHLDERETRHLLEASLTALSPYQYVPLPRNPLFTGREEILEALHAQLSVEQAAVPHSLALCGLGGVGKTQVALEYAYRYALEYSAVLWIGAEAFENIVTDLLRVAKVLQLPERESKDQQRVVAAVQQWLATHSQWLLIWDNVEDLNLLNRFLPASRSGAILITTRYQVLGTLARGIDLFPMEQEEGMLFLLRRAKVLEPEATREQIHQFAERMSAHYAAALDLVIALGGLPLALDQAGAYLEEARCGLPAYLDLFRTRRTALLGQRGTGSHDHPDSVFTTFTLALIATAEYHPAVWDLLRICALLQPDAIPEEFFHQGAEHLGATLGAICRDPLEWNRVVGIACAYSLLSRQPDTQTLSLHRLVQAVLLDAMSEEERKQWNELALAALDVVFPEMHSTTEYGVWKQGERWLPHALLCLNRAGTAEESLAFASLACNVAQYLYERGEYTQPVPLFRRALAIRERMLGPDHPEVAHPLNGLAVLYWKQGKYAEAEPLCRRALSVWEQALGPDHPQVTRSLTTLAILCWDQGKYAEAEPLFRRALAIREQSLGPDHIDVAAPLNNLADVYREQGKYAEAEPLHQRALAIREQNLGPDHPVVAVSLNNLAGLYLMRGEDTRAEPLFRRALAIREQTLGPDHPDVATSLTSLAELYCKQGKYTQAESFYQRALRIREQSLGPDHVRVASSLNNLANLFREQGKYKAAEPLYLRACAIREQHLGQQHPEAAQTLHDLALLRQKQGKVSEARALAEHALSICSQSLGETHPQTVAIQTLSAQLSQEQAPTDPQPETGPHTMSVAVQGEARRVAYTRTVRMHEVTFTCTVCGQTVTQLHYPSGQIKYCSEACRATRNAQVQEERVRKQREKRQREAHSRTRLGKNM